MSTTSGMYKLMLKSATGIKESPKKINVLGLMQDMAVNTSFEPLPI